MKNLSIRTSCILRFHFVEVLLVTHYFSRETMFDKTIRYSDSILNYSGCKTCRFAHKKRFKLSALFILIKLNCVKPNMNIHRIFFPSFSGKRL